MKLFANFNAKSPCAGTQVEKEQMKATDLIITFNAKTKTMLEVRKKATDLVTVIMAETAHNNKNKETLEVRKKATDLVSVINLGVGKGQAYSMFCHIVSHFLMLWHSIREGCKKKKH